MIIVYIAGERRARIKEENEEIIVKNNGKRQTETHPPKLAYCI